jgi:uncharacterized protein YodC (DUF2158 family)
MTLIKPGDEVRLKSGGPMMTVSAVEEDEAICLWFEGQKQKVNRFNIVTLVHKSDIPPARGLTIRAL